MKHIRFILFLCILALLTGTTLDAAPKPKRGVQVTPKSAPALDSLYHQSYAVIIGVDTYDKWPSLEYAVKDARAMQEKLKSLGFQTTIILDQHATKDNILKILGDDLPQKVQKNDRVVIFFAGHGQTEEMADGTQMGATSCLSMPIQETSFPRLFPWIRSGSFPVGCEPNTFSI